MASVSSIDTRRVHDVVDGGGLYFSRLATAGPYAFLGGVASDESGGVAAEARVDPPYAISPAAHVVSQTAYVFNRYKEALDAVGSGVNEMLQVEQHIPHKIYADGYIDTSRGKGFMDRGRPTSALLATGDLLPHGCVINPTGIALIPSGGLKKEIPSATAGYHESLQRDEYGDTYAEEGPFNEIVTGGGYVFTVGDIANDWSINAIPESVRVSDSIWWGCEIRNETDFLLARLRGWLEKVGSGLDNVVHLSVYLLDMQDLFEFDRTWRKWFPTDPPARSVIPVRGLGQPRIEAKGLGHKDNAVKTEFLCQSIRPGYGLEREVVSTGTDQLLHEPEAIKAGPLLWISGQYAGGVDGLETKPDTASQLDHLFGRLDGICRAGGTSIDQLVRLRAFLSDPLDAHLVYAALKRAVPSAPPSVMVTGVPGPFPIPGATVMLDAVANVSG
jgi:enamine deaminase RidA (YjgF/YER057c/UK114 family)